jgi:hypothetical protein
MVSLSRKGIKSDLILVVNQQRQIPLAGGTLGSSGTRIFSSITIFLATSGTLKNSSNNFFYF